MVPTAMTWIAALPRCFWISAPKIRLIAAPMAGKKGISHR